MNVQKKVEGGEAALVKTDPNSPCIKVLGADRVAIKAGTVFNGVSVAEQKEIPVLHPLLPGRDYIVIVNGEHCGVVSNNDAIVIDEMIGGFHYAPGGNATARGGGDTTPAINPCSVWDRNFRPACGDARGMTLIDMPGVKKFWCDIYLLAEKHDGLTSRYGVTIADGDNPPQMDSDEFFDGLDYATAVAVMKYYDKQLLSFEEFAAAAFGVTEKSSVDDDPDTTKLDAPRTSRFGVMQATGNLWVWGHDGDPDSPRPSIFGGSWLDRSDAGSRYARLGCRWPGHSGGVYGARGRSDHLQLG